MTAKLRHYHTPSPLSSLVKEPKMQSSTPNRMTVNPKRLKNVGIDLYD